MLLSASPSVTTLSATSSDTITRASAAPPSPTQLPFSVGAVKILALALWAFSWSPCPKRQLPLVLAVPTLELSLLNHLNDSSFDP
jgi:hypothetical protein